MKSYLASLAVSLLLLAGAATAGDNERFLKALEFNRFQKIPPRVQLELDYESTNTANPADQVLVERLPLNSVEVGQQELVKVGSLAMVIEIDRTQLGSALKVTIIAPGGAIIHQMNTRYSNMDSVPSVENTFTDALTGQKISYRVGNSSFGKDGPVGQESKGQSIQRD